MKKILLMAIAMAVGSLLSAQVSISETLIAENFDSYTADDYVATQSSYFTTWGQNPGGADDTHIIDSIGTPSGSNCFIVNSSATDMVCQLGDWSKGAFEITFKMLIAEGAGGYFNLQKDQSPGEQWGGEVYFRDDSTGYLTYQGVDYDFVFNNGEWTNVRCLVSLDLGLAWYYINAVEIAAELPWDEDGGPNGDPGLNTLGGINFYGTSPDALPIEYYIDDVTFSRVPAKTERYASMESGIPNGYAALTLGESWDTWTGAPGGAEDAMISNEEASSGLNSIYFNNTSTDLIHRFNDINEGRYELSFDMMVDDGFDGYYNLMHVFDNVGANYEWACDVYLYADGTGLTNGAGVDVTFNHNAGEWNRIEYVIDLDNDRALFYLNGMFVSDWDWSLTNQGVAGLSQLAVIDFYPAGDGTLDPSYYVDNLNLQHLHALTANEIEYEDFSAFYSGEYFALGNPQWSTWTDDPGSSEDSRVTDALFASEPNSLELLGDMGTDIIFRFGNDTSGAGYADFNIYVPIAGEGYYNIMHVFDNVAGDYEWALECYFNGDGSGTLYAGGDTTTFSYSLEMWVNVKTYVDLTNDYAAIFVDDEMVYEWQFSLQPNGSAGMNQLAVMDLYPPSATSHYYMDDIMFYGAPTGLSVEESAMHNMTIYPNPANDRIFIDNDINEDVNLRIYNAAGQEVMAIERVFNNGRIEIPASALTNGIYFIQLENKNISQTQRVIIQH
jgi:hypothetical protein